MSGKPWCGVRPVLAFALFLLALGGCGYGSKAQHGNVEVFYTEGATQAEADKLGPYLVKTWNNPADRRSVQLKKSGAGYVFRMVIKKEMQNDPKTMTGLEIEGARISRDVFDGAAVEVQACDEYFNTVKALPPRADIRYGIVEGKAEIFYATPDDKEDAQRLGKHLATKLLNAAAQVSFKLAKHDKVVEVHMVANQELLKNPAIIAGLRNDRQEIAKSVFPGKEVELHLCDDHLNEIQVLKK